MQEVNGHKIRPGEDLSEADLSEADLSEADLSGANLPRAKLNGADLSGADLAKADLSGADLSGATLSRADVKNPVRRGTGPGRYRRDSLLAYGFFWATSLIEAKLNGTKLKGADLSFADLSGADLSGARLFGANLSGTDLSGADLSSVDLSGPDIKVRLYCDESTIWPEGYTPPVDSKLPDLYSRDSDSYKEYPAGSTFFRFSRIVFDDEL